MWIYFLWRNLIHGEIVWVGRFCTKERICTCEGNSHIIDFILIRNFQHQRYFLLLWICSSGVWCLTRYRPQVNNVWNDFRNRGDWIWGDLVAHSLCALIKIFESYSCFAKHNSDKMLYSGMMFQKLLDQHPQSDFFRVWTAVTAVFPKHNSDKMIYILEWYFKSCLIEIHKVISLEYELQFYVCW